MAAAAVVGACVDPVAVREMPPPADPFAAGLHRHYLDLADSRDAAGEALAASFLADKARAAARGAFVAPESLDRWRLEPEAQGRLEVMRLRLVSALAEHGRSRRADAAARAQTLFDCWVAAEEAGTDPDGCRRRFADALAALEAAE